MQVVLTQEAGRSGLGRTAAIEADLEVIQAQLARLPTRWELAQTAVLTTLTGAAIVLAGIEALFR